MKFKCIASGNVYEFSERDAEDMLKHPDYEVVEDSETPSPEGSETPSKRKYTKTTASDDDTPVAA